MILRVDRFAEPPAKAVEEPATEPGQLALFDEAGEVVAGDDPGAPSARRGAEPTAPSRAPALVQRARAVRPLLVPLLRRADRRHAPDGPAPARPGSSGLAATEIGDAVHRLLELVDLDDPLPPEDLSEHVRGWYPTVDERELERISGFVRSYCESELARRVAALPGAQPERPFAFEHDGVLLRGRLDVLQLDRDRAVVVDYKTNSLEEGTPDEIVETDYRLQRLVYALACFRAGAQQVEVVYHFLERPDAVVTRMFTRTSSAGSRTS